VRRNIATLAFYHYLQNMVWVRLGLVAFVLLWLFDVAGARFYVPIWAAFLVALGLEVQYFFGARRVRPRVRERDEGEELLLVRDGDDEFWIPYAGESAEEVEALVAKARAEPEVEVPDLPQTRRSARPLLVGLGVIAALAAVVWIAGPRGWDGLDDDAKAEAASLFSAEASRIVGRPVEVRCDESRRIVGAVQHSDGVAEVGGDLAYLTPDRCYDLYRQAFEGGGPFSQTARAVAVLAHEAWHLRGERNEGRTECFALQSGVGLARRLGATDDTARRMMRQQLAENALRARGDVEYLVPPECRDGGELDLDPGSSRFP
jgi:hypothetical protein